MHKSPEGDSRRVRAAVLPVRRIGQGVLAACRFPTPIPVAGTTDPSSRTAATP